MEGFLENLGWVGDVFDHPKEVYEYFSDKRIQSSDDFNKWSENLETRLSDNTFKGLWSDFISSGISFEDLELTEAKASRASGAEVLSEIAKSNEFILGGSGDLAASTKQLVGDTYFTKDNPLGRNIEYGVREHAMAGITNGIVLHSNLKAFASTFLVFSDYMRPSIRLSALMGIDSVFIFTHDSLLLGEDGPTHQPVEHLMSLRLIPNLDVVRPSNGNEINYAYRYAFSSNNRPTSIILSRQGLEPVNSSLTQEEFDQGAYIVKEGSDASIFASGSEVSTALKIVDELKEYSIQVVSVPILNKLIDIDNKILEKLRGKEKVFTLEIGTSVGWADYIGKVDESFSLNSFGSSAPKDDLENFFKLDIKTVSERIKKKLN